jgi:hypothetical protein
MTTSLTGWKTPAAGSQRARLSQQIRLLHASVAVEWRQTHALVFKDRPDYRFVLAKKAKCWISLPSRVALLTALSKSHDCRQHLRGPRAARQARLWHL